MGCSGKQKGSQCLRAQLGHHVSRGHIYKHLALQAWGWMQGWEPCSENIEIERSENQMKCGTVFLVFYGRLWFQRAVLSVTILIMMTILAQILEKNRNCMYYIVWQNGWTTITSKERLQSNFSSPIILYTLCTSLNVTCETFLKQEKEKYFITDEWLLEWLLLRWWQSR